MGPRVSDTGLLNTFSLTLIAVVGVVTILGILWGIRMKRGRAEADAIEAERVEEAEHAADAVEAAPPEPAPLPPPVAPAVPPLDDAPVIGTPAKDPAMADEPILAASPTAAAAPEPALAESPADRKVITLKGLGPRVAKKLAEEGITNVSQLAALDAAQAEALDARMGPFTGRMARDRWIEQARFLAAGDVKGFEAVFGRL